jgi:hypothetical protein
MPDNVRGFHGVLKVSTSLSIPLLSPQQRTRVKLLQKLPLYVVEIR